MHINKVVIKNYRCIRETTVSLQKHLNIIVGNNECGKSTFLEAVNLALSGLLNGRSIHNELHTHLFNAETASAYIKSLIAKKPTSPPSILIELYLDDSDALSSLKGKNNSLKQDMPGIKLAIEFNDDFLAEYQAYIADPAVIRTIPVEYYTVRWRGFSDNDITSRSIPIKPSFIDASTIRNNNAASRYVLDTIKSGLTRRQQVDLALSYRMMKDRFLSEEKVKNINSHLADKTGTISNKSLTVSSGVRKRSASFFPVLRSTTGMAC